MNKKPNIVAHRGGASLYSENSLSAFKNAINLGVDEVECDVHLLKSGEVVVFHDFSCQQLLGVNAKIAELDNDERQKYMLRGANEPAPLLEELLVLLKNTNIRLRIEIKSHDEPLDSEIDLAKKSCALIEAWQMGAQTTAISFAKPCLMPFIAANIEAGLCLDSVKNVKDEDLAAWRQQGIKDLGLNASTTPNDFVDKAVEMGFKVGVWTVNGPARLAHWLSRPVSYITSDQPDLALKMRG